MLLVAVTDSDLVAVVSVCDGKVLLLLLLLATAELVAVIVVSAVLRDERSRFLPTDVAGTAAVLASSALEDMDEPLLAADC